MKIVKQLGCLLSIAAVIVGCTATPPKYPTALNEIQTALEQGSNKDRTLAASYAGSNALPPAVKDTLLPAPNLPGKYSAGIDQRFNVAANDVPAQAFFMGLVKGTNYNMVVSPEVKGNITLNLKNVTVEEALEAASDAYGYDYQRTPYGYQVSPPQLETRMFTVNYLDMKRTGESKTAVDPTQLTEVANSTSSGSTTTTTQSTGSASNPTGSGGSSGNVTTKSEIDFWTTLTAGLKNIIGDKDGRNVTVNPASGLVVIRAYPAELREVARYLSRTQNSMERQVILEAKILEVNLKDQYSAGINWSMLGTTNGNGNGTFQDNTLQDIVALLDGGDIDSVFTLNAKGDHGSFAATIQLLETQGNVQVLSSPRISTVNNQKAIIKVGDDQFYVTGITNNQTVTDGTQTNSPSVTLTPFFAGITLDVTPQINDTGDIILHIHPAISTVKQENRSINLGASGELDLPTAASTIRETDSVIHARNGQIVILGGLMQSKTAENIAATPGASRIPFFGALFRNTVQSSGKSELVILLKPIVTNNDTWSDQLNESSSRFKSLDRGFHVGAHPEVFGTMGEQFSR